MNTAFTGTSSMGKTTLAQVVPQPPLRWPEFSDLRAAVPGWRVGLGCGGDADGCDLAEEVLELLQHAGAPGRHGGVSW